MLRAVVARVINVFSMCIILTVLISGCSPAREISYVALGDSIPGGWGVGSETYCKHFAAYLQHDLGVSVDFHNYAQNNGERTDTLLKRLQTEPQLRQAVAQANVITIWIGANDLVTPHTLLRNGKCEGENFDCFQVPVKKLNQNINAIFDEILGLNPSKETRIMIADNAIPVLDITNWKNLGSFYVLQEVAFESWQQHIHQAALERGIIVVPINKAINVLLGNQVIAGIYQGDDVHFNQQGHKLIADLHRQAWE